MMSLRWQFLGALMLMIVLTAAFSLGLGYLTAQRLFDGFVDELARNQARILAQHLSRAYTEAAGWQALDEALAETGYLYANEAEHEEGNEGEFDGEESDVFHIERVRIVIVDLDYRIIRDNFYELETGLIASKIAGRREEILDLATGHSVGYAHVDVHQDFLAAETLGFARDLLASSAASGMLIVVAATFLATTLSRRITAPVAALTKATQAIANRDRATLLPVKSTDELGTMSSAFNQMTTALQKQRDLRRRLITDVSHELNTPLSVIQLEAKALVDDLQTPGRAARNIIHEVSMLRYLVKDLTLLAETDAGELHLQVEPCAIGQLLSSEVERWQPLAQTRQTSLLLEPVPQLPALQLDQARIRQALGNIVRNALQHTDHGTVLVTGAIVGDRFLQISVKDDGEGIAGGDLDQVFDRHYRSNRSHSRAIRGEGLGLAIARTIINAHLGAIAVSSEGIGRGTTVTVKLPMPRDGNQD